MSNKKYTLKLTSNQLKLLFNVFCSADENFYNDDSPVTRREVRAYDKLSLQINKQLIKQGAKTLGENARVGKK